MSTEYDATILRQLVEGIGRDGAGEVLQTLVDDGPRLIGELSAALARGDAKAVRLHAHTLKSSARIAGAVGVGDALGAIEDIGVAGVDLAPARAAAPGAIERFERLMRELREWLATP